MLAGSSSPASGSGLGFDCSVLASPSAAVELENGCSSGSSSGGHMLAAQQRRRSLYAATSGDYNRLLQQQQQWPGPSSTLHHSVSTPSIPRGMRRSSNSSSGSGSSTKARRAATTLAAAAASEQQQGKQHGQQQQQPANGRPLTRSWSWPWGLSSCTAPSCSCSTEYEGEVPAAAAAAAVVSRRTGSSSRLLSEAGLAAVAGVAALHPAVQAYLQGSLGIAFSGGGFRWVQGLQGNMNGLLNADSCACKLNTNLLAKLSQPARKLNKLGFRWVRGAGRTTRVILILRLPVL